MQKEKEFILIYQAALEETRSLLEEARANRQYQLELGQGNEKDVINLEVDHWTRGELSAYEDEIRQIEKKLTDGENTLTSEQVREILKRLEKLKPRIMEIVEHARQNILGSQVRYNIAEMIAKALGTQMFDVVDTAYEGDDERNAYVAKLKNRAGSEVVTVISPMEGEFGKNRVSVHSYDETFTDENTLMQRAKEITQVLSEEELQVGTPECAGRAKTEYQDISVVRGRKIAERAKT